MKQLLLLVFFTVSLQADAQKVRFTDSTNEWEFLHLSWTAGLPGWIYLGYPAEARFLSDTTVHGITYRQLWDYRHTGSTSRNVLIREDTAQGKIWFRYSSLHGSQDTVEDLLFDYSLQIGDTTIWGHDKHAVVAVDSVLMGAEVYRTWTLRSLDPMVDPLYYTFVEGIGPLNGPLFSIAPASGLNNGTTPLHIYQLRCFYSQNSKSAVTPPLQLPQVHAGLSVSGIAAVPFFDNNTSCSFVGVGISTVSSPDPTMVYPNPGDKNMILQLSASTREGKLHILDVAGRSIYERSFVNVDQLPIGQYLSTPGVYFYILQDAATGRRYTGRFTFR